MADDVASEEMGDVTGAVVPAAQDRPERQESQDGDQELATQHPETWGLLSHWRPVMFLLILVIAGSVGFTYKARSDPATETAQFRSVPPQSLDVYVSDPHIQASVTVAIYDAPGQRLPQALEWLYITIQNFRNYPGGAVLITSNIPGMVIKPYRLSHAGKAASAQRFATLIDIAHPGVIINSAGRNETLVAGVFILHNITQQSNGSIFGHLPSVGALEPVLLDQTSLGSQSVTGLAPQIFAQKAPGTNKVRGLTYDPSYEQKPNEPYGAYVPTPNEGPGELFWVPRDFAVTEAFESLGQELGNYQQVDYASPEPDILAGTYSWNQPGDIEPVFRLSDPDAAASQSKAAFISGIAFGVAGAAAIALVQELPDKIPLLGRRRKSRSAPRPRQEHG